MGLGFAKTFHVFFYSEYCFTGPALKTSWTTHPPGGHHPVTNDDELLTQLEMQLGPHARLLANTSEAIWWCNPVLRDMYRERDVDVEVIVFKG